MWDKMAAKTSTEEVDVYVAMSLSKNEFVGRGRERKSQEKRKTSSESVHSEETSWWCGVMETQEIADTVI